MKAPTKLKAGRISRIRVNPTNCISVLDVVEKLPIPFKENMSFDQQVSMALSSLLETARQHGLIPDNDGFDYLNRMSRFNTGHKGQHGKKLEFTKTVGESGSAFVAPTIQVPAEYMTTTQQSSWAKFQELAAKRERSETDNSVVWTEADEEELDRLAALV